MAVEYRVSLLAVPAGATTTNITSISDSGRIAGKSRGAQSGSSRPTYWEADGTYEEIGGPASRSAICSSSGEIAIISYGSGFSPVAVDVRLDDGSIVPVELPTGNVFETMNYGDNGPLYFVNDDNVMYRWTAAEGSVLAADFSELSTTISPNVSETGMIAGSYSNIYGGRDSIAIVIGQKIRIEGFGITDVAPGNKFLGRNSYGAGIWTPGQYIDFIQTPPESLIFPNAINSSSTIVGTHKLRNSDALNGFIRYGNDPYIDFGTVSDILSFGAEGYTLDLINDHGVVAGHMRLNGVTRAFTATPVPEPATLLGLAIAGLVLMRKRKS